MQVVSISCVSKILQNGVFFGEHARRIMHGMSIDTISPAAPTDPLAYEQWLDEIVSLAEGARLRKVHPDTLRREAERGNVKILRLSLRRKGIRRRDAMMK